MTDLLMENCFCCVLDEQASCMQTVKREGVGGVTEGRTFNQSKKENLDESYDDGAETIPIINIIIANHFYHFLLAL